MLKRLERDLQELFTPKEFDDVCPNGLQVEGKGEIKKLAFAVSGSLAAIQEAIRAHADALIVHHGLFWNKDPYPVVGPKKEKIELLLKHGVSLFAYHLPLDAHPRLGNNWKAARDLGFFDLEPFSSIGVKAKMSPRPILALKEQLEQYYGHAASCALGGGTQVSSIAIVSGGAHREIKAATEAGVDCFVTGSFDEWVWDWAHEHGIHFLALGHYCTERIGIQALMKELTQAYGLESHLCDLFNPF